MVEASSGMLRTSKLWRRSQRVLQCCRQSDRWNLALQVAPARTPVSSSFEQLPGFNCKHQHLQNARGCVHLVFMWAGLDTGERRQKKQLPPPLGHAAVPRTDNLYSHLTYKPMSEVEHRVYSQSLDDAGGRGRAHTAVKPGTIAHGKGPDMLAWRPEQQLGAFVPRSKSAPHGSGAGGRTDAGWTSNTAKQKPSRRHTPRRYSTINAVPFLSILSFNSSALALSVSVRLADVLVGRDAKGGN
eukprot:1161840-Pelagomonas_calceolata.AAC.23